MADTTIPSPNSIPDIPFSRNDVELLGRYQQTIPWPQVLKDDQELFHQLRERLRQLATAARDRFPGRTKHTTHLSHKCPNGRSPRELWSCIYPASVAHKSFALQVAAILSARGAEICCCLGAGAMFETKDNAKLVQNQRALEASKARLKALPASIIEALSAKLAQDWHFQREWRLDPSQASMPGLREWIEYASGPEGAAASISSYLSPEEIARDRQLVTRRFLDAVSLFAPLIDGVYTPGGGAGDSLPPSEPEAKPSAADTTAPPHWWALAAGEGGRLWNQFQEGSLAAIGWDELGDLGEYPDQDSISKAIIQRYSREVEPMNDSLCCWQFAREMKIGDMVVAKAGRRRLLGVGTIESDYFHEPSRAEYRSVRRVRWLRAKTAELPENLMLGTKTLTNISKYEQVVSFIQEHYFEEPPPPPETIDRYSIDDALYDVFMDREQFEAILGALRLRKNVILEGPPGVGKSFLAKRLAYALLERKDESRMQMVQFHQSYAYEDFVQGFRPAGAKGFEVRDGVFYEFCGRARADSGRPYVFIIDEINRGNLSRILGDLMMLIEPDKRGSEHAIRLTYMEPGERFSVPENVHLLGLMNTADRSLAMVDYALRRRFRFISLRPQFTHTAFAKYLESHGATAELTAKIIKRMCALNDVIEADHKNLGPGFAIGHSFFCMNDSDEVLDMDWYRSVIDGEIVPLLTEYWFDRRETAKKHIAELIAP